MAAITTLLKTTSTLNFYLLAQSLTYEIASEDVYEELFKRKHLFDFSNYPKDSKFFDETSKKNIGKMKDGSEGKIIGEFCRIKVKDVFYEKYCR